jgi:hypothetical protein
LQLKLVRAAAMLLFTAGWPMEETMFDRLIKNQDRHAKLMGEMMRRYGVLDADNFSQNDALSLSGAARRCMGCRSLEQCEKWMAETTGTEGSEAFCPNVRTFAGLTA